MLDAVFLALSRGGIRCTWSHGRDGGGLVGYTGSVHGLHQSEDGSGVHVFLGRDDDVVEGWVGGARSEDGRHLACGECAVGALGDGVVLARDDGLVAVGAMAVHDVVVLFARLADPDDCVGDGVGADAVGVDPDGVCGVGLLSGSGGVVAADAVALVHGAAAVVGDVVVGGGEVPVDGGHGGLWFLWWVLECGGA